ncbi:MAG: IS21-like element helper ATPase IstB, partial [Candidatus Eremiobacteraeota bacterium]|nr:IS21-like element helper ATPase IstB [Candidatus Eremiobacteraeota bacterium]
MASEERDRLLQNLRRLSLPHAAQNIDEHLKQASALKLGHLGFLARIVEAEIVARQQTRSDRRMRYAEFPEICRIEDYDFKQQPSLDRKAVLNLAELGFVDRCESVLWIGPSGVGKTHLSIALGVRACEANYSVRFVRASPLLRRLYASLADDTLEEALDELAKPDVLIIDELGNSPKKHDHDLAGVFFELVARRYRKGAMILATNLGFDQWSSVLGSPSQVTPAIDRLIEGAHIITF